MVQAIENSPVPVIIFISPSGSRAGSAGFFLLEAADIAAMAPGTNAGAAHPIVEGQRQIDPILKQKIENDAAAFLRSYTARRGRNAEAAEDAVRNSKSYSDDRSPQAQSHRLIDSADDAPPSSHSTAARSTASTANTSTLHLTNAAIVTLPPSTPRAPPQPTHQPRLRRPALVLGGLLIYLEFNVPGTIVPGSLGTLLSSSRSSASISCPSTTPPSSFSSPRFVMIVLEAKFASHGILAVAGIVCLIFGLATLVDGPIPELRVHLATALAAGLGFGAITFGLAWIALRARRNKVLTGPQAMIGGTAIARTPLTPTGQVEIRGELWQASLRGHASASHRRRRSRHAASKDSSSSSSRPRTPFDPTPAPSTSTPE